MNTENPVNRIFPIDPMVLFYAMVTAVEGGKVGEIDTDFRIESQDPNCSYDVMVSIVVRRDPKPVILHTLTGGVDEG